MQPQDKQNMRAVAMTNQSSLSIRELVTKYTLFSCNDASVSWWIMCWMISVCCQGGFRPVETDDESEGWAGVIQRVGRDILLGGQWRPPSCEANTHLAVIIPCRDRDTHLRIMLRHLIPVLQRQLTHFRIFVVEQVSSTLFSRTLRYHCKVQLLS